jgi:hypothetical protein
MHSATLSLNCQKPSTPIYTEIDYPSFSSITSSITGLITFFFPMLATVNYILYSTPQTSWHLRLSLSKISFFPS